MNKKNLAAIMLILAALIGATLFVSPLNRDPLERESGNSRIEAWEYMPRAAGIESIEGIKDGWTGIDALDPDMIAASDVFWIRGRLPENFPFYSPALYLKFDFPVEVFVDGQKIYSYSTMEERDRVLSFQHLVPIRDEHKGKVIYFRYPAVKGLTVRGLKHLTAWDMVSESEKKRALIDGEVVPVILCTAGSFIGLSLIVIAIFQRNSQNSGAKLLANAGGFVFLTSLNILSNLYMIRSAINQPVIIFYTDYISYFLIPYTAGSFVTALLKVAPKARMNVINNVFPLFLVSVLLLSRIPGFDISRADYVFNTCFLAYTIFLVHLLLKELREGSKDLKIIIYGLVLTGAAGVFDILTELKVNNYSRDLSHYGIFVLSLCMICFLGLRHARMYDEVKAANVELTRSKEYIEAINKDLDRKVIEKTSAIRSLFDNAEQGFLSISEDLKVKNEYSYKCCEIFGGDINGESLPKLIGGGNQEQEKFINTLLQKVFTLRNEAKQEVYLSLLPAELNINGKLINIAYKMIDKQTAASKTDCMVIFTDVTDKHLLEERLENERSILKMAVMVVAAHNDFVNAVCEYKDFCENSIDKIVNSDMEIESKYAEIFRAVHTFKGTFSQLELQHTTKKLHDFETTIDHFMRTRSGVEELQGLLLTNKPGEWLEEDFDILREVLGERYLKLDKLVIAEESKFVQIENKILDLYSGSEGLALVKELKKLRSRSIKEMLRHYPEYCKRLSERMDKPINDFDIQGSDIAVNPDIYSGLSKAMVHIFRNILDHGIETTDERVRSGKPEAGSITCNIKADEEKIEIITCDDGAGIDIESIREKAARDHILLSEEAAAASDEEVMQILFSDGFTTADQVTEFSGRGVGLAALKAEVERLHGSIEITSRKGQGTCFHITVPVLY